MRKIAYAFASITVASCLGYFAGKGASYFKPQEESSDFASKSIKTKFKSLKLRPLPTKPEAFASLKSMAEIEKFLVPYHERGDMKWDPGYSVYIPAFDSYNRPYFRYHNRVQNVPVANGFQTLHQGDWTHYPINPGMIASLYDKKKQDLIYNSQQDILWDPKMAVFDADDTMYTVLRFKTSTVGKDTSYVMLYSKDKGLNWKALPLAGTANTQCVFKNQFFSKCKVPELYDLERPYSSKPITSAPAMLYYVAAESKLPKYQKAPSWLGTVGLLYFQPITKLADGTLKAEEPILVSDSAQEIGYRSGSAPKIVRDGTKYFITWLEANRLFSPKLDQSGQPIIPAPDASENPFSAVWVAEYDSVKRTMKKKAILKTWPVNDTHNQPGIVKSSDGILHVIAGGHGSHFTYAHTTKSSSIDIWTDAVPMNTKDTGYKARYSSPNWTGGSQTYISMMIDSKDVIHTAYRQWAHDASLFDFEYYGALVYQSGKYNVATKTLTWNKPNNLVTPNASEYTHWYQVMALDRKDHIYLEYSNMRPAAPYALKLPDGTSSFVSPYLNNALLRSDDGGTNWYLPSDEDFKKAVAK